MENYIRNAKEADKGTVFTEIVINATPEKVRKIFLQFERWSEWNTAIPYLKVTRGDINDLASKPKLELALDLNASGKANKLPVSPSVYANDKDILSWGLSMGFIMKVEHTFLFEPINRAKATRLVHYERANGLLSPLFMTNKTKHLMQKGYNRMNADLKRLCEQ